MTDDEDLWSDEISALIDAAFETVSRNPSDHEEAFAYRRAIAAALRQPTQSDVSFRELAAVLYRKSAEFQVGLTVEDSYTLAAEAIAFLKEQSK